MASDVTETKNSSRVIADICLFFLICISEVGPPGFFGIPLHNSFRVGCFHNGALI
jgi:hypothetical protein